MKNILFIHSSSEMYGSDRSLLYLIKNLDKSRFKLHVLLPCEGPLVDELKIIPEVRVEIFEVAVLRRKNFSPIGLLRYTKEFFESYHRIKRIIKQNNIDVVYTNTAVVFPGAIAAKHCKIKNIWHIREIIKNKYERKLISIIVNHYANNIIANSKATGKAICKSDQKLKIVYNAVEEKYIDKSPSMNQGVTIGMAGRINRWKGQKLFVDAAEIIYASNKNANFVIAGSAYTGEEFLVHDLRQYIKNKGLEGVVKLLGQVNNMDEFYQSLDIFVLPSIQPEPFGLVIIEAMEMGIPVVATNHGGPTEILDDGENGFLVDYIHPNQMAHKCIQLVNDENLRNKIGYQGQLKKRRIFSVEQTVLKVEKVLELL